VVNVDHFGQHLRNDDGRHHPKEGHHPVNHHRGAGENTNKLHFNCRNRQIQSKANLKRAMEVTELRRAANIAAAVVADVAVTENQSGAWLQILSLIFKSECSCQLLAINKRSSVPTAKINKKINNWSDF